MDKEQICKACSVKIINNVVYFSLGSPTNREFLFKRVCQYAKKEGCINKNESNINY